jgi:molybdopterin synthase catalytic subunit
MSGTKAGIYRVVETPIDLGELIESVSGRGIGGIATFLGSVRSENEGKRVLAVEYQAYDPMAEKVLREIGQEARRGHDDLRISMVHRVGRLEIGEVSVGIAAGSTHRREALAAVAYAIERVKESVPIWKREYYADGSAWLGSASPPPRSGQKKGKPAGLPPE